MPAASPPLTRQAEEALAELGAALRLRRQSLKVNATAAAEAAGMSRVTFHRIEKGEPSVTAGAYAAAALALGMRLQASSGGPPPRGPDRKGWIPARVSLSDFPKLKELAWHVHGTDQLLPREALDIYERNWRHLELETLSPEERDLIDALREALGDRNAV